MSNVTNTILSIETLDSDEETKIKEINVFFKNQGIRGFVSLEDPSLPKGWYAGEKLLEANLYLGVFNYLKLNELIRHIQQLEWPGPTTVQLFVKEQEESRFKIYDLVNHEWDD